MFLPPITFTNDLDLGINWKFEKNPWALRFNKLSRHMHRAPKRGNVKATSCI